MGGRVPAVRVALGAAAIALLLAPSAPAYVGPGIGLGLIGSVFGAFWAVLAAAAMVLYWPIKWAWRRYKKRKARGAQAAVAPLEAPPPVDSAGAAPLPESAPPPAAAEAPGP